MKDIYYSQGLYPLRNPLKYKGTHPLCYRSHPEFLMMRWFDTKDSIIEWTSESVVIPYIKPTDGKVHRYFVDFSCILKNNKNELEKYLIEYKPYKQTIPPSESSRKAPKTLLYEQQAFAINSQKWEATRQYAAKHNMKFVIVTEKDINQ